MSDRVYPPCPGDLVTLDTFYPAPLGLVMATISDTHHPELPAGSRHLWGGRSRTFVLVLWSDSDVRGLRWITEDRVRVCAPAGGTA